MGLIEADISWIELFHFIVCIISISLKSTQLPQLPLEDILDLFMIKGYFSSFKGALLYLFFIGR